MKKEGNGKRDGGDTGAMERDMAGRHIRETEQTADPDRMADLNGKKVLVIGLGKSGTAAAEALKSVGARVCVYDGKEDEKKRQWAEENGFFASFGERPASVEGFDLAVLSPGVPADLDFILQISENGTEVIGELELAYRLGRGKYIAITGTNGKTTTTALTGEIFRASKRRTEVVGNIGVAVVSKALTASEDTFLVTECSSFQLETIKEFHPFVSALLNVTPDHLNRHKTMENYIRAKARIFENQTQSDYFVYNSDDEICSKEASSCRATAVPFSRRNLLDFGAFVRDGKIVIADGGSETEICGVEELLIPGSHNLENALAAAAIAWFSGIGAETIAAVLRSFPGVSHRLERCGEKNGVSFVNDSKGTNPDAAIRAVRSFHNIVLIAGGYDKGAEFGEFAGSFDGHVRELVLLGTTAPKIRKAAEDAGFHRIHMVKNMKEAVNLSWSLAEPGDTILLSPACASWDMYEKFEDRGDDFKRCVAEL